MSGCHSALPRYSARLQVVWAVGLSCLAVCGTHFGQRTLIICTVLPWGTYGLDPLKNIMFFVDLSACTTHLSKDPTLRYPMVAVCGTQCSARFNEFCCIMLMFVCSFASVAS